jgi:tetratricopeptide (TPR) repeat protein
VAHLEEALRLNPNFALARQNLEQHRRNCEQKTATEAALRQKVREQPDSAAALLDLGNWLINQRKLVEALECFRQVLRRDTNSVAALNRTAWILATHEDAALRNGAEALILAQRACQLTRQQDALSLNTLAAAYAELGQFNDATTTARQALDLATQSGQKGVVSIVQNLLKLYQAGQPYREMSRP